ncbi:hypothetical protein [Granulicoccus phenolivorans]|uniref:hypothetical protein n=1 Tax=Granulicoccus phenolivorans TaxID=266854 RepID=UPI00041C0804|nr:hypothetical protein [Granulicoccus phenolivorans]
MTVRTMRLFEDRIEAGAKPIYLPYGDRAIFVREGAAHFVTPSTHQYLSADLAYAGDDQLTLEVESLAAVLWRFELADGTDLADEAFALRSAPQATSELKLAVDFDLDDRYDWLLRCDTVTFPAGGVAWTHLHQGPGLRITRYGEITIETDGTTRTHGPGDPWAEFGVLPVLAPTTPHEATSFTRCFALPAQLKGVSSLRTVHAEDRAKPNTQSYRVLAEYAMDA